MSARILIVEDEAIVARDIQATLKDLGYVVPAPVASGAAALEAIASHRPDLVLMDVRIQGEMDGIETAGRIRAQDGPPVVYLTSNSDDATLTRAKATGAYGYLLKPFGDRDLRTAIEVALQKRELDRHRSEGERWFATTLKSIGDAVIATDTQQRITFMNAVAERVTGWKAGDATGKELSEVLRLVDQKTGTALESPLAHAFRDGFAIALPREVGLVAEGRGMRAIDDTTAPIVDERGATVGGVVVFRDVTERRQLEDRLAHSERLAAIGTLSAGMSHEINNPLAYVSTNVAFVLEALTEVQSDIRKLGGPESEAIATRVAGLADALTEASEGSARIHGIIHDLRKCGRLDVADRALLELTDVVDDAIRTTETLARYHARVRREYKTTPFVEANEGQLGQVFVNLLSNAAEAMGEGLLETKEIVVATFTDEAGRSVAEIRDTGPGISPETQRRIFEPFFTTLGLSIAHSIVRSLGGEISLESVVGKGTTFRVSLLPAKRPEPKQPSVAAPPPATRRGRVLVIDDEPAIGRAISRFLQREHDTFVVTDAREALSRIAAGEVFDVLFCDVTMPDMTGMDFFEALSKGKPELARRIVFVTGGALTETTEDFLGSTSNAVLRKPVDSVSLRRIAADYVGTAP